MKALNEESFVKCIAKNKSVVLIFSSDHCSICHRYIEAIDNQLVDKYPDTYFLTVDFDDNIKLVQDFEIKGTPETFIFLNGKLRTNASGAIDINRLEHLINRYN